MRMYWSRRNRAMLTLDKNNTVAVTGVLGVVCLLGDGATM